MEMYIACVAVVLVTLFAKGFTVFKVDRMRTDLVRSKREMQQVKGRLADLRKDQADLLRSCRAKEVRVEKLKKEIAGLEQRRRA